MGSCGALVLVDEAVAAGEPDRAGVPTEGLRTPALVADALLTLATHGTAVFAHPGTTDLGPDVEDEVSRLRSETQNTRFLGALGFVPVRDRLWALDLATGDAIGEAGSHPARRRWLTGRGSPVGAIMTTK